MKFQENMIMQVTTSRKLVPRQSICWILCLRRFSKFIFFDWIMLHHLHSSSFYLLVCWLANPSHSLFRGVISFCEDNFLSGDLVIYLACEVSFECCIFLPAFYYHCVFISFIIFLSHFIHAYLSKCLLIFFRLFITYFVSISINLLSIIQVNILLYQSQPASIHADCPTISISLSFTFLNLFTYFLLFGEIEKKTVKKPERKRIKNK